MAGLFNALNSARTSLEVNQKAIEIVGNNISNVNTEGYSRQKAEFETYPALSFGNFFVGQGVKVSDVSRDYDVFIDRQIKQKAVDFGLQDALTLPLSELERVFTITEDNISTDIDNFFDSVQELSADPSDLVQRNNVILHGEVLSTSFNNAVNELNTIKENINNTILSKLDNVNAQLQELADLNDRIYQIEIRGQSANGARDQRDMVAKELAQTLGAQFYADQNGMMAVMLPGGLPLVQGNMAMSISAVTSGADMTLQLNAGGVTRNLGVNTLGGEFHGLLDIRDNFIPELNGDLDKLAYELSVQINVQHQAGGALDSSTGNLFFSYPPNYVASPPGPPPTATEYADAARNMSVVITDAAKIAAGAAPDPGPPAGTVAPGDNSNALILSNIGDNYLIGGTDNFTSLYGKIAAKVGVESNQNQLSLKGAEDALVQLENFREGLVGVSLEEEMISLIQYQRGFQSSAKFLTTVDEMMSTILEIRRQLKAKASPSMKVTENSTYRLMRTNLDRITTDLLILRNQGTTGLKLNKPSDDPGSIRPVLTTRSQMQQNARYIEAMGQASDKMTATDSHLASVENLLVRAKEIALNAVNGSLSQTDLATLADEMAELKNQLLDSANAVINGKYIFSGYQENTKSFTANPTYDPDLYDSGDVTTWPYLYNGDHNPTRLEITPGEFLETNLTGNELFFGITNEIAAHGYSNPYQGESITSSTITAANVPAGSITVTVGSNAPVTIPVAGIVDLPGHHNFAGSIATAFSQLDPGLVGTANEATVDLGPLNLTNFIDGEDAYMLNITSGGNTVSATLNGPSGSYDYTLSGLAFALASTPGATNLTATSGTLSNGVSYEISSGSLVLTGPADGSEIDIHEELTGNPLTLPNPTGGITGGPDRTVYGTVTIPPNSVNDVSISGAVLTDIGLATDTLSGASGRVDIFTVFTRTEEAIRAGNIDNINGPGGSLQAQIDNLEIAADQNRTHRSTLGARAMRVDSATVHQEDASIDLKQILSRYQDADILQVYNDIIQKETAFQAALNITGRISQISILDYF